MIRQGGRMWLFPQLGHGLMPIRTLVPDTICQANPDAIIKKDLMTAFHMVEIFDLDLFGRQI